MSFFGAEHLIEHIEHKYGIIIASEDAISIYSADMPDTFEIAVWYAALLMCEEPSATKETFEKVINGEQVIFTLISKWDGCYKSPRTLFILFVTLMKNNLGKR